MRDLIRNVPDFPQEGVIFRDIAPLLADASTLRKVIDQWRSRYEGRIDYVAAIEARGFVLGAPLAYALGVGFIPLRKAGKLPPPVLRVSYALEYAEATIELSESVGVEGTRVLVVDDVLATGGTAAAACALIETAGAYVAGLEFLIELPELNGRSVLERWNPGSVLSLEG